MACLTKIGSLPWRTPVSFAAVLGLLMVVSARLSPAYSGEYYYDRYDQPYRYDDSYDRSYRYDNSYARPYRYRTYNSPWVYGSQSRCYYCGCGWRCHTPIVHHHPDIIERRYVVREYVERRYAAPWHRTGSFGAYTDDVDDVPRPPAPVVGLPAYYDYDAE